MGTGRVMFRVALVGGGVFAIAASVVAFWNLGGQNVQSWATLTASLAVLAALVSVYSSQRVIELHEDAQAPKLVAAIDARSRNQLVQFRLTNAGASTAYNVRIDWTTPLIKANGDAVTLGKQGTISSLLPNGNAWVLLGAALEFYGEKATADLDSCGTISFEDATGRKSKTTFETTGDHERKAMTYISESEQTHKDLQEIPKKLEDIVRELRIIRQRGDEDF